MHKIKVSIIEDEKDIREGLYLLLNYNSDIEIVATYENCDNILKELKNKASDVLLMDINLGGKLNGIEATQHIKAKHPNIHIIILTIYNDHDNIFKALQAGATGYLTKTASPEKIITSVKEIYNGGSPMTPDIARKIVESFYKPTDNSVQFSEREKDVLKLLENGYTYNTIAQKLFISLSTVKFHIQNIYEKLHVKSKEEALIRLKNENLY